MCAKCKDFAVKELEIEEITQIEVSDKSFKSVIVVDGHTELTKGKYRTNITKCDSIFILAQNDTFEINVRCNCFVCII